MIIKTSDIDTIKPFIKKLKIPEPNSHKGQNGKVLVIGGSSLFHSASIWAAEVASHFTDIVHYSSTVENNKIMLSLKKKFRNGIVIPYKDLFHYIKEDKVILLGPGMMRVGIEGKHTYDLTRRIIEKFPDKKFVFDAGALQMMKAKWLSTLKTKPIVTPHQEEFYELFDENIINLSIDNKALKVRDCAKKYQCVILLKAIIDIISDGDSIYYIYGGNAGLTKGGTGDILAGLALSFYEKTDPMTASILASYLLKKTADTLFTKYKYWYNIDNIINTMPTILKSL